MPALCGVSQVKRKGEPCTLYAQGRILGYKRCDAAGSRKYISCRRALRLLSGCLAPTRTERGRLALQASAHLPPPPAPRRSKVNQYENTSLLKIEHVNQRSDTDFYLGKR